MKRALTIYVDDDSTLAQIHGTVFLKKAAGEEGELISAKNVSFLTEGLEAVLIQYTGDIMAVKEETKRTTKR